MDSLTALRNALVPAFGLGGRLGGENRLVGGRPEGTGECKTQEEEKRECWGTKWVHGALQIVRLGRSTMKQLEGY
jgi:hypothetical protein